MLEIDCTDEAIIDADPATVLKAIADESMGKTHWWLPCWEGKPRGDIPYDQVSGMIDVTVHKGPTVRFTLKTVEVTENRLRVEVVGGDFRGEGIWTFEPVDGKTRARFRWHVRPTGLIGFMLRFAPPEERAGRSHREVMKAGFEGLNQHLRQLKAQAV